MYKNRMTRKEVLIEHISEEVYLRILCEQYGYDPRRLDEAGFRDTLKAGLVGAGLTLGSMAGQAQAPATAPTDSKEVKFTQARTPQEKAANVASFDSLQAAVKKKTGYPLAGPTGEGGLAKVIGVELSSLTTDDSVAYTKVLNVVSALNKTSSVKIKENVVYGKAKLVQGTIVGEKLGTIIVDIPNRDTLFLLGHDGDFKNFASNPKSDTAKKIVRSYRKLRPDAPISIEQLQTTEGVNNVVKELILSELLDFISTVSDVEVIPTENGAIKDPNKLPVEVRDKLLAAIKAYSKGGGGWGDEYHTRDIETGEVIGVGTGDAYNVGRKNLSKGTETIGSQSAKYSRQQILQTLVNILEQGQFEYLERVTGKRRTDPVAYIYYAYILKNSSGNPYITFNVKKSAEHILNTCIPAKVITVSSQNESRKIHRYRI